MNDNKIRDNIIKFMSEWKERGSEKSDAHLFWLDLLSALGLDNLSQAVELEKEIDVNGHKCFVDVWIKRTHVLIEHKSRGVDLDKPARQSDGSFLTPYEQAKRYADCIPRRELPNWIVVCNFDEFRIYNLNSLPANINAAVDTLKPQIITFKHLVLDYRRLMFLIDPNDENIEEVKLSKDAVNIIHRIRDAFARKMLKPRRVKDNPVDHLSPAQKDTLNKFCVRLVFCLYAENSNVFAPNQFVNYIQDADEPRKALIDLFETFRTPVEARSPSLDPSLKSFPYVGGKLFAEDRNDVPEFNTEAKYLLIDGSKKFNWFAINPTIFGALFESNLSDNTRRSGGMHFTSRANIHRLIDPLFLDDLHDEFKSIRRKRKNKIAALEAFQERLAALTFLDPACGSGNFLTEIFISLRQLENRVLDELINLGVPCTIKVSIDQFFGIELNDFACAIAQTAMWISENKMLYDTDVGIREHVEYLPLKHSARIVCANALTIDWREVVPEDVDYIIGNPPFSGARFMSATNKADLLRVFDGWKGAGNLDYVCCWFKKSADFIRGTDTRAAFVSTNSICQGESVSILWSKLLETVHIDFAHRTFKWTSESDNMAAVYCVIVGFSVAPNDRPRIIFDGDQKIVASNINAYLLDAPNFYVESRSVPLCDVPKMCMGSMPNDGGNLIIEADEYEEFVRREPRAEKFIRRFLGAEEFLKGRERWCLWLVDATEEELRLPLIAERVEGCRQARLSSKRAATRKLAATPALFGENRQPTGNFIALPEISSGDRQYIPMGFMTPDILCSNRLMIIPDAELYHFGVLMSSVHMAWMRVTCGRLGAGYCYSGTLVYNNFPWAEPTEAQRISIENSARRILDVRALYPDWTLAALYNESTMPDDLRAAHVDNDRRVMDLYGFDESLSEADIVSRLMELYQRVRNEE